MIDLDDYKTNGFTIARGLFSVAEAESLAVHFTALNAQDIGGYRPEQEAAAQSDPLKRYPRMVHMHRWDGISLDWLLDERIRIGLTALLGHEPYAVQTMFYFKPPGARWTGATSGPEAAARAARHLHGCVDGH